jgi:hypothetical protein
MHCMGYIYINTNKHIFLTQHDILLGYKPMELKCSFIRYVNHIILITKMVISKFRYGVGTDICALFDYEIEIRKRFLTFIST